MVNGNGVTAVSGETGPRADERVGGESYPLTPLQEGMLFHHLSEPGSDVDLEQIICTLRHPVDLERMREAWTHAAARHPRLGASFEWTGVPAPIQHESPVAPAIEARDLSGLDPTAQASRVRRFLEEDRRRPFELRRPPLLRLTLLRLGDADHRLVWSFPHILMDGRSFPIVLRTVFDHYDGISRPEVEPGGTSPPFRRFVAWERARDHLEDQAFWTRYLEGYRTPVSILQGAREPAGEGAERDPGVRDPGVRDPGARGERRETSISLDRDATLALEALGRETGIRLHTLVHGAWALALGFHSGEEDVVFGTVCSGRSAGVEGARDMVGVLINAVPVRARLDPKRSAREWLAELQERERSRRPFEQSPLVRIQQWSEVPAGFPLFESLLVYDHAHLRTQMRGAGHPSGRAAGGVAGEAADEAADGATDGAAGRERDRWAHRDFELLERTPYPLTLYACGEERLLLKLAHDRDRMGDAAADRLLGHVAQLLREVAAHPGATLGDLEILTPGERTRLLEEWNRTALDVPADLTLHGLVTRSLRTHPDRIAVTCGGARISAGDLDALASRIAGHLRGLGVGGGDLVGVALPRSLDQVATLLGILQVGAAYVPLDPGFPPDRLDFMVRDAGLRALVATRATHEALDVAGVTAIVLDRDLDRDAILSVPVEAPGAPGQPDDAVDPGAVAYVIYTSGSTGRPKGVQVEHRNVVNFLFAMDRVLGGTDRGAAPGAPPEGASREASGKAEGAWLSMTSLSFDISVLELFWPLARGLTLVLHHGDTGPDRSPGDPFLLGGADQAGGAASPGDLRNPMEFSLFYFASDAGQDEDARYRLLLEGAKFADAEGFSAVWTPERHFHPFGGLYPNPAVTGAAVAAVTTRVGIRAGSVVVALHHPVRIAEEWSVVDNLSGGRVGISIASGWHPDDFLLAPENHADRKAVMFRNAETIRRLWRGETVGFPGPDGRDVDVGILPRPVQPELPLWVTTAGNVETYREAGRIGARVLTHLLGQTPGELEERIRAYRDAWDEAGHAPGASHVTLMLHAFVGETDDAVRETVREPMKAYLRSSVGLIRNFAASWTAYRRKGGAEPVAQGDEFSQLSDEDLDGLLEFAFNRYFETSGLFGSPERCVRMAGDLHALGVDEIACLIDFGVETRTVLEHLPLLSQVRREVAAHQTGEGGFRSGASGSVAAAATTVAATVRSEGITHIQCTPSQLRMLLADSETRDALRGLPLFLVGGEALPTVLGRELRGVTGGRVLNMYGPTETTIWSSAFEIGETDPPGDGGVVPLGRPIANTSFHVLDPALRPVPVGVPGELFIGGAGVARGYLGRPELTAERFVADPFTPPDHAPSRAAKAPPRLYRTGDRVRYRADGVLEFLGRTDQQVKVRGHRIELGEVEAVIQGHPGVIDCAVVLREDAPGDQRLSAYLVAAESAPEPGRLEADVRATLAAALPAIMVPSSFTLLDRLPLTPNRKVDRKALPPPSRRLPGSDQAPPASSGPRPVPQPPAEGGEPPSRVVEHVASIWKELLGLEDVGLDENFFDLGGHSLLTVQVHGRIREAFDLDIRITDLFRFPTVRSLARFLASGDRTKDAGSPLAGALDRGAVRRQALRRRSGDQR